MSSMRAAENPQAAVDALLAADRAFSSASAKTDFVSGLSAMLDEKAIIFVVPLPPLAHGKAEAVAVLKNAKISPNARTQWTPIRGGISADGQQGFTYGYMTTEEDGKPAQLSKYLSYWVKRPEGWRVALFKRVPRPEGKVSTELRPPSLPKAIVPVITDAATLAKHRASLDQTERTFSDEAQSIGLGKAFKKNGSADAMNVGGAAEFTFGNEAISASVGGDEPGSPLHWGPEDVIAASSGDLGATWGLLLRNGPTPPGRLEKIPFFTIWHRNSPDEPWLYIAE
jgi:hypothetical protein